MISTGKIAAFAMTLLAAAWIAAPQAGATGASANQDAGAAYEPVGAATSVPWGWVDYCRRYADECDGAALPATRVKLDAALRDALVKVDDEVNAAIDPVTAMDHWGVVNKWDLPLDGRGDCNSYVLMKRKMLLAAGVPRQALLATVVIDKQGEGHLVLTVATDRGDLVLDNLEPRILPWDETGYDFVKRQSQEDPNVWISVNARAVVAAAN
ncbi:MAG: transglutaminase-like cysteine peptidase [Hyphomicrobiales bacterium]|nr:transglutaminase-like cysteine peptidase [Hyphomicrobiales bacterium]